MEPTYPVQGALHTGSCKIQAHDRIAGFCGMCGQAIAVHLGQSQVLFCFPGCKGNMLLKLFSRSLPNTLNNKYSLVDFILGVTLMQVYAGVGDKVL